MGDDSGKLHAPDLLKHAAAELWRHDAAAEAGVDLLLCWPPPPDRFLKEKEVWILAMLLVQLVCLPVPLQGGRAAAVYGSPIRHGRGKLREVSVDNQRRPALAALPHRVYLLPLIALHHAPISHTTHNAYSPILSAMANKSLITSSFAMVIDFTPGLPAILVASFPVGDRSKTCANMLC